MKNPKAKNIIDMVAAVLRAVSRIMSISNRSGSTRTMRPRTRRNRKNPPY
ncbi:MAG: hypothetical protein FWG50_14320 [Kiritimatiellaeota bacterium]|nr:hypothetical protein [Kiritimatiellota bacterium]